MMRYIMQLDKIVFACLFGLALSSNAAEKPKMNEPAPQVRLETNLGDVVLKLDSAKAPTTVENFLTYVKEGHYDGTIFHRVIPNFMAQGGGYSEDFKQKPTHPPIKNEADNGLKNSRGTIAMARTPDPNSATAQFFINFVDNAFLDYKSPTPQGWGYAVFGEVSEGMEVVDKMAKIPTGSGGPMASDVPQTPIIIQKATVVSQ
ncbi:peptidyl-prolyl cis-trans isomerase B [Methylocaldum marinum]|uniref:Peptidyl-prolyl cis-trans isomerase n=2 Tax=Methylocaldum marinum TaxID=1432792 RepID=A0A250KPC4_9GAMM|nr:peptidyl-prolyl cis-trans isomerase B [Methylocaldum marinum]